MPCTISMLRSSCGKQLQRLRVKAAGMEAQVHLLACGGLTGVSSVAAFASSGMNDVPLTRYASTRSIPAGTAEHLLVLCTTCNDTVGYGTTTSNTKRFAATAMSANYIHTSLPTVPSWVSVVLSNHGVGPHLKT